MKSWRERGAASRSGVWLGGLCVLVACTGRIEGSAPGVSDAGAGGKGVVTDPAVVGQTVNPKRETGLQRLSKSQYVNTLADVFSPAVTQGLELEVDYRGAGFTSIGGREVAISRSGVRKYEAAARVVAARVVGDVPRALGLAGCEPSGPDDEACMRTLLARVGRRLFRRPLEVEALTRHVDVGQRAALAFADFWRGAELALTGLLLSPHFLYQVELGVQGGSERVLSDSELATRLSYFLWDSAPDEALLDAAEGRGLYDAGAIRERLLADPERLARGVRAFADGLLALHVLDEAAQAGGGLAEATPDLYASMKEATQLLALDVVVAQRASFLSLLDPGFAFVDARLSTFYGAPPPAAGFVKLSLAGTGRVGLLTEPAILTATSRSSETSPTLRGIFVSGLVCYGVPPPPADVNATLPERAAGVTRREQLELHISQPKCAACHETIDPIGYGLEGFDALGRARSADNSSALDTSGSYFQMPFDGPAELSQLLRADPRLGDCVARKAYMHGLGRIPAAEEEALIAPLAAEFSAAGHDLVRLFGAVASSGLFRLAPKPSRP